MQFAEESFDPECEGLVIQFCLEFVQTAIEQLRDKVCLFVVVDNAEGLNVSSWRFFEALTKRSAGLVLIMCFQEQTNYFHQPDEPSSLGFKFEDIQAQRYFKQHIKPVETEIFVVAEMKGLLKESLRQALLELGPVYERTMGREIEDMTEIIDPKKSAKVFAIQKEIKTALLSKYQVFAIFQDVQDTVIEEVIKWTDGNA